MKPREQTAPLRRDSSFGLRCAFAALSAAVLGTTWLLMRNGSAPIVEGGPRSPGANPSGNHPLGAGSLPAATARSGGATDTSERGSDLGSGRGLPGRSPSTRALRAGYETEDMSPRDMLLVLIGLALFAVASSGAAIAMSAMFHRWDLRQQPFTAQQIARIVPPAPHLQSDPYAQLRDTRAREEQLLNGYMWLNRDHTAARIPIARAMALTVGKSLDPVP